MRSTLIGFINGMLNLVQFLVPALLIAWADKPKRMVRRADKESA